MKNKFFFKNFIKYILILFFVFIILVFFSINYLKKSYLNNIKDLLKNDAYILNEKIKSYLNKKEYKNLDDHIKQIAKDVNISISVINYDGKVLADSEKIPELMENQINCPEIVGALKNRFALNIRYSSITRQNMIYFAHVFEEDNTKYFLRTSYFIKKLNKDFGNIRNSILIIASLLFLIFILVIYFYSQKLYEPVKILKNSIDRISKGDFNFKIILHQNNEFKELANNLNLMIEKLKESFLLAEQKQSQIDSLISFLADGILAIDLNGKIIFKNNGFCKIVNADLQNERYYWEFLLPLDFIKIIEKSIKEKKKFFTEIEIKNKIYFCNIIFLDEYAQIIFILHDISAGREYEKIKKDLVANVSHELKTPLTAIKGFSETILDMTKEKEIKKYVEIILNNTNRLISIVNDLLILSKLENVENCIEKEKINLSIFLVNIIKIFEKKLKEKKLNINIFIDEDCKEIFADVFMFEQLFINLIDNAIKYTEKGEIKVQIYKKDNKHFIIEFTDTGIGIPKEHIPRIFERFYVVDKSRSKEMGGTGLGLSIVKHIVNLHNGEILVDSELGKGTKFVIVLPFK